ncbi:MAG: PEP-CTERM sorting domain-containing protein [Deltaproteobacteria bacterium]|nr:PEP-CTERM sorting domain-containing protein [Deltaproteobacteria bacterium]
MGNAAGGIGELSHFTGMTGNPVPELATMLLLGTGLLGLAGLDRRKFRK